MEYIFDCWQKIKDELADKFIFLLLDYDGTLTPIVETPGLARIPEETKAILDRIAADSHCGVAVISGRSLSDLRSIVGLSGIVYAGNHGLEIEGPKIRFESGISPDSKSVIRLIAGQIKIGLAKINGVLVEDKGLTISAHYRLVDARDTREFLSIFHEITGPYVDRKQIKITHGKKVCEVRPPVVWDKGKAVVWLLARQQFMTGEESVLPVYIGDDLTDEDAFKALKNKGLTIFVGEGGNSQARYYVKSSEEVTVLLRRILGTRGT